MITGLAHPIAAAGSRPIQGSLDIHPTSAAQAGLGKRGTKAPAARLMPLAATVGRTMTESAARVLTEITTLAGSAHANPLYPPDAPLIRVSASGQQDPVTVAIARHISDSGSVFLELPDGRLTVVLHLDGITWTARPCDEAIHR
jgi:hypothetical protein